MKIFIKIAICIVSMCMLYSTSSAAAIVCVQDKDTGKYMNKATGEGATECDSQNSTNLLGSITDGENIIGASGTKIINGVIVTNAIKLSASSHSLRAKPQELKIAAAVVAGAELQSEPGQIISTVWTLAAGHTVGQELQMWGEKAGWKVIWNMQSDWSVPTKSSFSGDFETVASEVIKTLAANGALVRAQFYQGNKTMVVTGPGTAE